MRFAIALILCCATLHAGYQHQFFEEDFGVLAKYRWYEVHTLEQAKALPAEAKAVATWGDPAVLEYLSGLPGIEALRVSVDDETGKWLRQFKALRVLDTCLDDESTPWIAGLSKLETLVSTDTTIEVSDDVFSELSGLSRLHSLVFGGGFACEEQTLTPAKVRTIASLPALRRLDLTYNVFEGDAASELKAAKNLEELLLYSSFGLKSLHTAIAAMPGLKRLVLGLSEDEAHVLSDSIESAKALESLTVVGSTADYTGIKCCLPVGLPATLKHLRLHGDSTSDVTPEQWARVVACKSLESLEIYVGCEIEAAMYEKLSGLPHLTKLAAYGDEGILRVIPKLKTLQDLTVTGSYGVGDRAWLEVSQSKSIKRLFLRDFSYVGGEVFASFANLLQLEVLKVHSTWNVLVGLEKFAGNSTLRELELTGLENFNDGDLAAIKSLSSLRRLALQFDPGEGSVDTTALCNALAGVSSLVELRLSGIHLQAKDLTALSGLLNLVDVYLEPGSDAGVGFFRSLATLSSLKRVKLDCGEEPPVATSLKFLNGMKQVTCVLIIAKTWGEEEDRIRAEWTLNPLYLSLDNRRNEPWIDD
ncbi:MAG: hypothetical protein KDB90_16295 [Planctomycetes bacterium]|nr:hypothetical protein [Planctomycetota bacterium]